MTCFLLSASPPANLLTFTDASAMTRDRQTGRKTKFPLCLSIVIAIVIVTDLASSGSWCLVSGSRGSGVSITHGSWLVVSQRRATQTTHSPFTKLKGPRLKTVCVRVCGWACVDACAHICTYLVHCLHGSALLSAEKKPFLHATQIFLPLVDSGISNMHCGLSLSDTPVLMV